MPKSGSSGGMKRKYNTKDWELLPIMRFLDKTLERRPVFEQLDVLDVCSTIQESPSIINVPETNLERNSDVPCSLDDEMAEEFPSSFDGRSQNIHPEEDHVAVLDPDISCQQQTLVTENQIPGASKNMCQKNQQKRPLENEFPIATKKARANAKTYEDERRTFINKITEILTTSQTTSNDPKNTEERMAQAYADYVKMRFLNWSKEKMIEGFAMLNETIEEIEKKKM
ncbi:uncharacterized protein LOC129802010 [Phlebotomus papatasi]|nr:uncharacterized protein LOC129802010 [Phlebotomus papatasi]